MSKEEYKYCTSNITLTVWRIFLCRYSEPTTLAGRIQSLLGDLIKQAKVSTSNGPLTASSTSSNIRGDSGKSFSTHREIFNLFTINHLRQMIGIILPTSKLAPKDALRFSLLKVCANLLQMSKIFGLDPFLAFSFIAITELCQGDPAYK